MQLENNSIENPQEIVGRIEAERKIVEGNHELIRNKNKT